MMALNFDFDMLSPGLKPLPGQGGAGLADGRLLVALFRDPETVEALARAPQPVQDYLRASHFGVNSFHSGAPRGRYPEADDAARIEVIEALAENVRRFDLPRADDSQPVPDEFHLPSFFAAVAEAEPIVMPAPALAAAEAEAPVDEAGTGMALADSRPVEDEGPAACLPAAGAEDEPAGIAAPETVDLPVAAEDEPSGFEAVADLTADEPAESAMAEEAPAPSVTDSLISMMLVAEEAAAVSARPADAPGETATETMVDAIRAPVLLLENPIFADQAPAGTDALIAGMIAGEDAGDVPDEAAAPPADGDEAAIPPAAVIAKRGLHLPHLPRWMTAVMAFAAVGVAVGTAMI